MSQMVAWMQESYGRSAVVRAASAPVPVPGPNEVLLRIHATALNAGDIRIMQGDPLLVRPVFGWRRPRNPIRGMDVAGAIVALGEGVAEWTVGAEVVCELPGGGGLGPFAVAPSDRLVARPEGVQQAAAACLPIAAGTAWQALDAADVTEGSRVLVLGASGGVGTFAVALAAARGAQVDASCGQRSHAQIAALGASSILPRDFPAGTREGEGSYDAVIDIAGVAPLRNLRRLLRPGGTVALVAGDGGRVWGPVPRMLRAGLLSIGASRRIRSVAATAKPEVLTALLALAAAGTLTPLRDSEFPFERADEALARLEQGHAVGKIVVHGAG